MPIAPALRAILQDAFDAAPEGQDRVLTLSKNNLHRNMLAIVKRAGVEPWLDLFQTLRRSCDTEWSQMFPQHVVDTWLGHSECTSHKHYLMVTDDVYDRAAGLNAEAPTKALQKAPQ